MNCDIERCLISYIDNDSIIFLSINRWPWELPIDGHHVLGAAQFGNSFGLYLKIGIKLTFINQKNQEKSIEKEKHIKEVS